MCIGLPMQVVTTSPGRAWVSGRGQQREVDLALVGEVRPGDWLLVFIDGARERLDAKRAREMNQTLDLVDAALQGQMAAEPDFPLPSALDAAGLAALTGSPTAGLRGVRE